MVMAGDMTQHCKIYICSNFLFKNFEYLILKQPLKNSVNKKNRQDSPGTYDLNCSSLCHFKFSTKQMLQFSRYYTVFYSIHPLITTELGPILILTTLNLVIFKTISKTKKRFVSMAQQYLQYNNVKLIIGVSSSFAKGGH